MNKCIFVCICLFCVFEFKLPAAELSLKSYHDAFCMGGGIYGSEELVFDRGSGFIGDLIARIANKKKRASSGTLDFVATRTRIDSEKLCDLRTFDSRSFVSRLGIMCDDNCIKDKDHLSEYNWSIPDCFEVCQDMMDALQKRVDYLKKKGTPAQVQDRPDNGEAAPATR
jgi:hypothetical protein